MKIKMNLDAILSEKIRDALINGDYQPGQRISFDKLCRQYEVSRTPVVQAVKLLAGENVLEFLPNGKICIPAYTPRRIVEICETRLLLERFAVEHICQNGCPAAITQLEWSARQIDAFDRKGEFLNARKEDFTFHRMLVSACENACLTDLYARVQGQFLIVGALLGNDVAPLQLKLTGDHVKLVTQLRSFEVVAALETIVQHIYALRDRLCAIVGTQDVVQ